MENILLSMFRKKHGQHTEDVSESHEGFCAWKKGYYPFLFRTIADRISIEGIDLVGGKSCVENRSVRRTPRRSND